jgi:hypothetical protein
MLEAASSFTSALFEIFANFVLAIAFKKVIASGLIYKSWRVSSSRLLIADV